MGARVVWFKRDLRVADHAPLFAAASGPVIPLYIVEPSIWQAQDFDPIHAEFILISLRELRERLAELGAPLVVRVGEAVEVFEQLRADHGIIELYAHEETGNALTYARDRAVLRWAKAHRIGVHEFPTNGVIRRLRSRNGWAARWEATMGAKQTPTPTSLRGVGIDPGPIPCLEDLGLASARQGLQAPGEVAAHRELEDFLYRRGAAYRGGISSPVTAYDACSRLSPYLTFGLLSSRQVAQATRARIARLGPDEARWRGSLRAFDERLHWRCHFVQKLESEPAIEHHNFLRALDGLRENEFDQNRYDAWCAGQTGYPMVDACMRALVATGWLNFRMRAMLAAFAAYHLWLHWRPTALFTARAWLDYEPGIHFSQFQMQSGTTGINTLRIYNPTKQAQDHDPEGGFIRRWVPELAGVPGTWIHTPWLMPDELQASCGVRIARDYPRPIVDHLEAVRDARARIAAHRRSHPAWFHEARDVADRHGSRKKSPRPRRECEAGRQPTQPGLF